MQSTVFPTNFKIRLKDRTIQIELLVASAQPAYIYTVNSKTHQVYQSLYVNLYWARVSYICVATIKVNKFTENIYLVFRKIIWAMTIPLIFNGMENSCNTVIIDSEQTKACLSWNQNLGYEIRKLDTWVHLCLNTLYMKNRFALE